MLGCGLQLLVITMNKVWHKVVRGQIGGYDITLNHCYGSKIFQSWVVAKARLTSNLNLHSLC